MNTERLRGAVSSVEDPEKMLDQTVSEMQNDLIKMRQASAQARAHLSKCTLRLGTHEAGLPHACTLCATQTLGAGLLPRGWLPCALGGPPLRVIALRPRRHA